MSMEHRITTLEEVSRLVIAALQESHAAMQLYNEAMRRTEESMRRFEESMRRFEESMRRFEESMRGEMRQFGNRPPHWNVWTRRSKHCWLLSRLPRLR